MFFFVTPTLAHAGLSLYTGLFPITWVLYGVSEILWVVAGAGSFAFAGYKLELTGKRSNEAMANSTSVIIKEFWI